MFDNTIKIVKNEKKKTPETIIKQNEIKEKPKEEHMEEEEEIKEQKNDIKNTNLYNLNSDNETELIKVELGKNIVARVLLIDDEKFIDFGKFYKGYPTKKNIRIKYNTYLKLNEILNK